MSFISETPTGLILAVACAYGQYSLKNHVLENPQTTVDEALSYVTAFFEKAPEAKKNGVPSPWVELHVIDQSKDRGFTLMRWELVKPDNGLAFQRIELYGNIWHTEYTTL